MYKIAILGCENSHADAFLDFIMKEGKYPDIEVVGVYSEEQSALDRMAERYGVYCMKSYDELAGQLDGLVITARHGKNHYKYAKPYIGSGIPMFIDKPITVDDNEAIELMRALSDAGVRVTGGSSCIHCTRIEELRALAGSGEQGRVLGGFLRAPIDLKNNYGDYFFYCQHLTEMTASVFGYYPTSVLASEKNGVINATVRYPDYDVNIQFVNKISIYSAHISLEKGVLGGPVTVDRTVYGAELAEYVAILRGGPQPRSYRDVIAPVFISNAIKRSLDSGREEPVTKTEEF